MPGGLRLRVPPALEGSWGQHVVLPPVRFAYGQADIEAALARGAAMTYRFLRRERKRRVHWYVQASIERPAEPVITDARLGAIGIDFNPTQVDAAEVDRFGNLVATRSFPVDLAKRSTEQCEAALAEVTADLAAWAQVTGKSLVHEELDFQKKKAGLREQSPRYARMLSAFAYRKFFNLLASRAARAGVELLDEDHDGEPGVNPAFTSVMGTVKFASGYGLSSHAAAAMAIARRGLHFGERLRSRTAFPLPARNRGKHVWSDWRRVAQGLRGSKGTRGRRLSEGTRGRGQPLSVTAPTPASAEHGPLRDGLIAGLGRDASAEKCRQHCSAGCRWEEMTMVSGMAGGTSGHGPSLKT